MDVKLLLSDLRKAGQKHPAFYTELLRYGSAEGKHLRIPHEHYDRISREHFGALGLGNLVKALATPVVIVASIVGVDLANCQPCAERRLKLNS